MTKKEAIHFLYQIADEIQSFLDKTSSSKRQWTSHKRLEALSMAISALYDLSQAEEDSSSVRLVEKPKSSDYAALPKIRIRRGGYRCPN